ncbi:U23 protein [macacine betaherpesvirus 9]|uniref:U23 protein n=1 Tax=macacine betaherpesvirus 9 TaxID=2560568 RepID=A0A192XPB1_9BETA|nr:U23 protein [macacine betaherpesvirus 9]ANC96586.1 U23 protein [macacine betaherpesvirus 9]
MFLLNLFVLNILCVLIRTISNTSTSVSPTLNFTSTITLLTTDTNTTYVNTKSTSSTNMRSTSTLVEISNNASVQPFSKSHFVTTHNLETHTKNSIEKTNLKNVSQNTISQTLNPPFKSFVLFVCILIGGIGLVGIFALFLFLFLTKHQYKILKSKNLKKGHTNETFIDIWD